ncbi:dnaJ homolog subfamily C member 30, mitochondrial-like [Acyrthosiphon pisum]|uniref:J domain-containing protein n=1 Tax=Acyrthosiphon pisum TaxID=7029 RepID=A0A8R1WB26_ACYPI|nr:dnaJ homolog subfamily C member 30, mitochondrial-like [Acyrthosiphon pisum]|eukprot:XP_003248109.2 PREDICTED: dnaJ homolog subfamily C member 30-like [Acyrthosiphon pisum]
MINIKDAYYRLSMIYHPDKNKGSGEASKIFRDITSAYEILGNIRQRKLYDSAANLNQNSSQFTTKQQPFETMYTKNDIYKTNVRSRDYNFEQWSKAHYTNVFRRHHETRQKRTRNKMNDEYAERQNSYNLLIIMVFASIFILISMFEHVKKILIERNRVKRISDKNIQDD